MSSVRSPRTEPRSSYCQTLRATYVRWAVCRGAQDVERVGVVAVLAEGVVHRLGELAGLAVFREVQFRPVHRSRAAVRQVGVIERVVGGEIAGAVARDAGEAVGVGPDGGDGA